MLLVAVAGVLGVTGVLSGLAVTQHTGGTDALQGSDSVTFAFVNVNVVPMTGEGVSERQTVLVRGGWIVEVGPAASVHVPLGAVAVQADGKYMVPGLAEMHAHIPGETAPEQLIRDIMFLYVANGVTTIRGMLGAPNQLALRERTASGEVTGPTIFVGAPSLNGQSAPDAATAARLVREHKSAGYDFLKLHPGLQREAYDAIVATAREVGITFAGHVSSGVGLQRTMEARQSTVDHLDGYLEASVSPAVHARMSAGPVPFPEMVASVESARLQYWAGQTREAGTWNVPTMALWEAFYSPEPPEAFARRPEMRYAAPQMVNAWIRQKQNMAQTQRNQGVTADAARRYLEMRRIALKALADSGAGILMGTDSPQMFSVPGFSLHNEIALMQSAGLTAEQVLLSGTRNVARYAAEELKLDGAFGTVAVGNRADLILLDANPLLDARNVAQPAGVMVRGKWLSAEDLQRGLEEIAARYRPGT
ncbi:MAG TPA: amidohydrolase family protein [Gemmatimonadaceae bacterium]|nr:amidohydrolase family protein [Gemmatimonadaceae bacterium]